MDEIFVSDASSVDDKLTVEDYNRGLSFEIDSPWSGSTEEGFGARLSINLQPEEVARLHAALGAWLAEHAPT